MAAIQGLSALSGGARSLDMTIDGSYNADKSKNATASSKTISVPAQKPLSHIAQGLRESIDAALTEQHLLVTAHGGLPPMCHTIKDFPMASLPPLSTSSPKFDQLYERRLELLRRNEENAAKRLQLTVRERTMIYGKVLAWCDDAIYGASYSRGWFQPSMILGDDT